MAKMPQMRTSDASDWYPARASLTTGARANSHGKTTTTTVVATTTASSLSRRRSQRSNLSLSTTVPSARSSTKSPSLIPSPPRHRADRAVVPGSETRRPVRRGPWSTPSPSSCQMRVSRPAVSLLPFAPIPPPYASPHHRVYNKYWCDFRPLVVRTQTTLRCRPAVALVAHLRLRGHLDEFEERPGLLLGLRQPLDDRHRPLGLVVALAHLFVTHPPVAVLVTLQLLDDLGRVERTGALDGRCVL